MAFDPDRIEALIRQPGTVRLASEQGRVSGPTYRERYRLPCGRTLDVTRDAGVGQQHPIVAFAIRGHQALHWQVDL